MTTPMKSLSIRWLNHASVIIEHGELRLLCDPWFSGQCFAGGWQLAYEHPEALAYASRATHLWLSHWHSDHFHVPTLKAIAARNPTVQVLANRSANFDMGPILRRLGFERISALPEREPLRIPGGEVLRVPTAGIDNMLALRLGPWSILNYNDCNLPRAALARIRQRLHRRYGPVDVLLSNYNHAGRLFEDPGPDAIMHAFWKGYEGVLDVVDPRWALPFASSHRYIGDGRDQNSSLLTLDALPARAKASPHAGAIVPWRIGDMLQWESPAANPEHQPRLPALVPAPLVARDFGASVPWGVVRGAAERRMKAIDEAFFGTARIVGPLIVYARDHDRRLALQPGGGARDVGRGMADAHLTAHSRALYDWLGRRFGDDSFLAGAHFTLTGRDPGAVQRWLLPAMLEASELDLRRALKLLMSGDGRRFLWNRREEATATVLGGRVFTGALRL